jgi:hypothetical protein
MKGRKFDIFPKFSNIVHAGIGSSVNLNDIDRIAPGDFHTTWAGSTCVAGRALFTVEGFGQYARNGGFADSPHAGEDIGMGYSLAVDRIGECLHDMRLPQDFFEVGRAVFPS